METMSSGTASNILCEFPNSLHFPCSSVILNFNNQFELNPSFKAWLWTSLLPSKPITIHKLSKLRPSSIRHNRFMEHSRIQLNVNKRFLMTKFINERSAEEYVWVVSILKNHGDRVNGMALGAEPRSSKNMEGSWEWPFFMRAEHGLGLVNVFGFLQPRDHLFLIEGFEGFWVWIWKEYWRRPRNALLLQWAPSLWLMKNTH